MQHVSLVVQKNIGFVVAVGFYQFVLRFHVWYFLMIRILCLSVET